MISVLLSALFIGSGLLALAVIGAGWRPYIRAMRTLPQALANYAELREVRVRVREVQVRSTATVLRPSFTAAARRPLQPAALPAAA